MKFSKGIEKIKGWARNLRQWWRELAADLDELDGEENSVPIYSYPHKYRWLFNTCLMVGTVGICGTRAQTRLGGAGFSDDWDTTREIVFELLPTSGISAVIIGVIAVQSVVVLKEVYEVLSQLIKRKQEKLAKQLDTAKEERDKEKARADKAEAEIAELRQQLEARNGESDREQQ